MIEHALSTKFGGPAVITQRNAFRPVAVEAEHDGVALLYMSGYLFFDCGEVVVGKRLEDRFKRSCVDDPGANGPCETVAVIELVLVEGVLSSDLDDGGHCPIILDT